jgi:hypothetical protein
MARMVGRTAPAGAAAIRVEAASRNALISGIAYLREHGRPVCLRQASGSQAGPSSSLPWSTNMRTIAPKVRATRQEWWIPDFWLGFIGGLACGLAVCGALGPYVIERFVRTARRAPWRT